MKRLLSIIIIILLWSCQSPNNKDYQLATMLNESNNLDTHPGKKLMETYCYVCHSPTASEEDRLAPPMVAIKKHYITNSTTKTEFIEVISDWIKDPTEDKARMYGAVRRFGVMVKMPYPEESIKQIADYMFDNEIDQPDWFEEHFRQNQGQRTGQN